MNGSATSFRKCSNCKNDIALGAKYFVCSVSSCQRVRAPIQFCSADCFEVHNEIERHKDGWALEKKAPLTPEEPPMTATASDATNKATKATSDDDVFIVVSRVKDYIKAQSNGLNSSDQIVEVLSGVIKKLADLGIEAAKADKRKTMLGRDIPRPPAEGGDILIVVSRLKNYINSKGELRTSDEVMPVLSAEVRRLCDLAVEAARKDGRKTVMGRDFPVA